MGIFLGAVKIQQMITMGSWHQYALLLIFAIAIFHRCFHLKQLAVILKYTLRTLGSEPVTQRLGGNIRTTINCHGFKLTEDDTNARAFSDTYPHIIQSFDRWAQLVASSLRHNALEDQQLIWVHLLAGNNAGLHTQPFQGKESVRSTQICIALNPINGPSGQWKTYAGQHPLTLNP